MSINGSGTCRGLFYLKTPGLLPPHGFSSTNDSYRVFVHLWSETGTALAIKTCSTGRSISSSPPFRTVTALFHEKKRKRESPSTLSLLSEDGGFHTDSSHVLGRCLENWCPGLDRWDSPPGVGGDTVRFGGVFVLGSRETVSSICDPQSTVDCHRRHTTGGAKMSHAGKEALLDMPGGFSLNDTVSTRDEDTTVSTRDEDQWLTSRANSGDAELVQSECWAFGLAMSPFVFLCFEPCFYMGYFSSQHLSRHVLATFFS